jgi:uncharacterized protein (TIGR03437 family)
VFNKYFLYLTLLAVPGALSGQTTTTGPTYRFFTNLGNIDVTLTPAAAPNTVANFINYVNAGAYVNSIFHRSVPGFVIQAGGYQYLNSAVVTTPTNPPVVNEFNVSNTTGTIAMAKLGTDPNSATSQWFFNLAPNGTNGNALDTTNGGYTVFGYILGCAPGPSAPTQTCLNSSGVAIMNKIAQLGVYDCSGDGGSCPLTITNSAFTNLPLSTNNLVLVTSIQQIPLLSTAGVVSSASYASNSLTGIAPGEIIAIFGQGMGPTTPTVATVTNGALPTSLAGVQVTFNGKAAPLYFVSAGQINVIAPASIGTLPSIDVVVTYNNLASNTVIYPVKPANPAIYTQNGSGTGDGIIFESNYSLVSASRPASVGDNLFLYGEGYGVATAATTLPDGEIVPAGGPYPVPAGATSVLIDGQALPSQNVQYFGGAPGLANGVLQVNFTVPQLAPGSHQIQVSVGGRTSPTGVTLQTK